MILLKLVDRRANSPITCLSSKTVRFMSWGSPLQRSVLNEKSRSSDRRNQSWVSSNTRTKLLIPHTDRSTALHRPTRTSIVHQMITQILAEMPRNRNRTWASHPRVAGNPLIVWLQLDRHKKYRRVAIHHRSHRWARCTRKQRSSQNSTFHNKAARKPSAILINHARVLVMLINPDRI